MKNWQIMEIILKKPLEEIVDVITGKWKCGICKDKQKYFSKESIYQALKEKQEDGK